jgi:tetratricopeptide (TPR) repeat protein
MPTTAIVRGRVRWRRWAVAALLAATAVAAAVGVYLWAGSGAPGAGVGATATAPAAPADLTEPPPVNLTGADPAIVAAVEEARAAVKQSPRSAAAWGRLGMVLMAHRFEAEAGACLGQAERLDPREVRWPYYHGKLLTDQDLDGAIAKLQRAVVLCGDTPDAPRLLLADTLLVRGRLDEAADQYRAVLARDPDNARARLGLGRLAYARNLLPEAVTLLRSSCLTDPRTRRACGRVLAEVLQHRGDAAAADLELQRVGGLPPDAAWPDPLLDEVWQLHVGRKARCERARSLFNQGQVREAIDLLRQTVRDYPHSDVAWLMLGQALIGQDDYPEAERALRSAVREAPDSDENVYYLGIALLGRHDDAGAAACFRKATELRPENAEAHVQLGQCLLRQDDVAGALAAFRAAVRYHPQSDEAHVCLAEALSRQGKRAEALDHLRQALQVNPANQRAKDLRQQLQK